MLLESAGADPAFAERAVAPRPFVGLHGSAALDPALRIVLHTQTQLSAMALQTPSERRAMADSKAGSIIPVCSIVLTVGITRFESPILRWPLVLLTAGTLCSLLFAILAVLPAAAYPVRRRGSVDDESSV